MRLTPSISSVAAVVAATLASVAAGQSAPPPPQSLQDVTSCVLDGSDVFVGTGRAAEARRYKYRWDAAIDALCNAKGFAIPSPAGATAPAVPAAAAAPAIPAIPATPATPATPAAADSTGFPPGATKLEPAQLTELVSGRVGKIVEGRDIGGRTQYDANGVVYFNGSGVNLSGRWRVEGSMLCYEWNRAQVSPGCNEVRMVGDRMYFKRLSGEIARMEMSR